MLIYKAMTPGYSVKKLNVLTTYRRRKAMTAD
jgi:hypothetical protein